MSRYAFYYVYAAIGMLPFKLGQSASSQLIKNLTGTMLGNDPPDFTLLRYVRAWLTWKVYERKVVGK